MKKVFQKLKKIVGTVSPLLGGALGGPLGGIAGSLLQNALGVDSEEAALTLLETNPDSLLKLKQVEADLKVRMKELGITEEQLHADDRDSARSLAKDKGIAVQATLTFLFIGGYFALIYLFFSIGALDGLSDFGKGQLGILIGVLTAAIPQILAFWFGSSRGSKDKTAIMANGSAS